jgi:hypothetical protein
MMSQVKQDTKEMTAPVSNGKAISPSKPRIQSICKTKQNIWIIAQSKFFDKFSSGKLMFYRVMVFP